VHDSERVRENTEACAEMKSITMVPPLKVKNSHRKDLEGISSSPTSQSVYTEFHTGQERTAKDKSKYNSWFSKTFIHKDGQLGGGYP
jgi:hypothetical protein